MAALMWKVKVDIWHDSLKKAKMRYIFLIILRLEPKNKKSEAHARHLNFMREIYLLLTDWAGSIANGERDNFSVEC